MPISPPKLLPAVAVAAMAEVASGILIDVCTDTALVLRVVVGCAEDGEEFVLLEDDDADADESGEDADGDDVDDESGKDSDNDEESDVVEGANEIEDVGGVGIEDDIEDGSEGDAAGIVESVLDSICVDEAAAVMLVLLSDTADITVVAALAILGQRA